MMRGEASYQFDIVRVCSVPLLELFSRYILPAVTAAVLQLIRRRQRRPFAAVSASR
jgi:hypothetical protein